MSFNPTNKEVEKYLEEDFQCIYNAIAVSSLNKSSVIWGTQLQSSLQSRFSGIDVRKQSWETTALQIGITAAEARLMLHYIPPEKQATERERLITAVNKANYLTNTLVGRVATTWYPDIERSTFDERDTGYENFLLDSIKELLETDSKHAMYARFFFAAKIKCVNDRGRLPSNVELQETENGPSLAAMRGRSITSEPGSEKGSLWNDRYSFIVVLGHSPLDWETRLSQASIKKAEICVSYNRPEISTRFITCGTSIRPLGTTIVEAFELKKYLMSRGIAPERILIDALSEHTNSNIWNAALLASKAGMPLEKKMIIFILKEQFDYVAGFEAGGMEKRTKEEVWPEMYRYLTIEKGEIENSVVVGFKAGFSEWGEQRLMWKNHVGKEIQVGDVCEN